MKIQLFSCANRFFIGVFLLLHYTVFAAPPIEINIVTPITAAKEGTPKVQRTINFTLDAASATPLVVSFNLTTTGGAVLGTNFNLLNLPGSNISNINTVANTFTIDAGVTTAAITLDPINDYIANATRTITLTIVANPPDYQAGASNIANVDILDDDNAISITATGSPTEDGATGQFTFTRANPNTGVATISFDVAGTAAHATHYNVSSSSPLAYNTTTGTIVLLNGEATGTITVTPINDFLLNPPRQVQLTLKDTSPKSYTVATSPNNTALLNIADGIAPVVGVNSSGTPSEAGATGVFSFFLAAPLTRNLDVYFTLTSTDIPAPAFTILGGATLVSGSTYKATINAGSTTVNVIIRPVNDFTVNAPRTLTATVIPVPAPAPSTYSISGTDGAKSLTINDDPFAITVNSSGTVAEGSTGTFTFTRGLGTSGALQIFFEVNNPAGANPALATTNYTVSSTAPLTYSVTAGTATGTGSITIPNGQTSAILNINTINDFLTNTNRNIIIRVVAAATPNYTISSAPTNSDELIISDASSFIVGVSATSPIFEGGASSDITFTRTGGWAQDVTVTYSIVLTSGTGGIPNTNYQITNTANVVLPTTGAAPTFNTATATGTVVVAGGGTSSSFTIRLRGLDDYIANGTRVLRVNITSATTTLGFITIAFPINNTPADIQLDDSPRQLTITSTGTPSEAFSPITGTYVISRSGGTAGNQVVNFNISGTATRGTHYNLSAAGANALNFPTATTGQITILSGSSSATITLTPINDFVVNSPRTAILTLTSSPTITVAATNNTATLSIDDDPNVVTIQVPATPQATEASGTQGHFVFTRNTATASPVTINFSVDASSTAALTTHYTVSSTTTFTYTATNGSITIPAGATSATLVVTPINDFVANPNRTIRLNISNPTLNNYNPSGGVQTATMTIIDDNNTVSIQKIGADPTKSGSTSIFRVTRSNVNTSPLTVNFTVAGDAVFGTHYTQVGANTYTSTSGTATIPAGQASIDITITPINDFAITTNRVITLQLSTGLYIIAAAPNNRADMTIQDDNNRVTVTPATATAFENNPATGLVQSTTFTVNRTNGSNVSALLVKLSLAGSAVFGTNYTLSGGTVVGTTLDVIIPAGQNSQVITVTPINDYAATGNKTVVATLLPTTPQSYTINGTSATSTITIIDDNNLVTITSAGTPTEAGATGTFTISRTTATPLPLVVNFTVGGTTTHPTHYTVIGATTFTATTGTATIPANATSVTITVQPINDFVVNTPRTVLLTVVATTPASYPIDNGADNATLTIDDDVNLYKIASSGNTTEDAITPITVTITRQTATASPVVVNFSVAGSATFGTNYNVIGATSFTTTTGTLTIPAGQTSAMFQIAPIDDNIINLDRDVILQLVHTTPKTYMIEAAPDDKATIVIANDDPRLSVIATGTPTENNQQRAKFVLALSVAATTNTVVNYNLTGTATASHFRIIAAANIVGTPTATQATIAAGSTTAEIEIEPIDDIVINPNETIIITLQPSTAAPADYFLSTITTATLTIEDNEQVVTCGSATDVCLPTTCATGAYGDNAVRRMGFQTNDATKVIEVTLKPSFDLDLTDNSPTQIDTVRIYNGFNTNVNNLLDEFYIQRGGTLADWQNYLNNVRKLKPLVALSSQITITVRSNGAANNGSIGFELRCVDKDFRVDCGNPQPTIFKIPEVGVTYSNNQNVVRTYRSSSAMPQNTQIGVTFTKFDVEASYDYIRVYDGVDTSAPLIDEYHNGNIPTGTIQSNNPDAALTFEFVSDGSVERNGFIAELTCGTVTKVLKVAEADSLALIALYNNTNIDVVLGWQPATTPISQWDGVGLNFESPRRVISLNLASNNIIGTLPARFFHDAVLNDDRMSRLQTLDLSNNAFSGTVPTTIGLSKLTHLNLSNNVFSGQIPDALSGIKNLVTLNLSSNLFDEMIDMNELIKLTNLTDINFSSNLLDGNIPDGFGSMNKLTTLNLSTNRFDGDIPDDLTNMFNIKSINLSKNNLTGSLVSGTTSIFNQPFLEYLDLSQNNLTGTLPADLAESIKELNLSNNQLTGTINNLFNLSGLTDLNLSKNQFSGQLPLSLDSLSNLINLDLSNNSFAGAIPAWQSLSSIRSMNLSFNKLTGTVPSSFATLSDLTELVVNDNQIEDLPNLSSLSNLKTLDVFNNRLTFEDIEPNIVLSGFKARNYSPQANINDTIRINTTLGSRLIMRAFAKGSQNRYLWKKGNIGLRANALPQDTVFTINSLVTDDAGIYTCDVTSPLVQGLTIVRNPIFVNVGNPRVNRTDSLALVALYRSTNGANWENKWDLFSPVRTWYGITLDIDRVVLVRLNDNKLEGTIPDSIRLLTRMTELNLRKNKIKDSIPSRISELISLQRLDLSGNTLTGRIPQTIGVLVQLNYLDLSENKLSNSVPTNLQNLSRLEYLALNDNQLVELPDLSALQRLKTLAVQNNQLEFASLEPNRSFIAALQAKFTYSPQSPINTRRVLQEVFGTSLTLTTTATGTSNRYQWTKSGRDITQALTTNEYKIQALSYADSGTYSCKVTNSFVPNLTLLRRDLVVVVNPPNLLATDSLALVDLYNSTNGAGWDKKWDLTQPIETWFGVVIDKSIGRVTRLLLSNNKLKGFLPNSIGTLAKLKELNIRANPDLTKTIPATIGNLQELEDLNLRGNGLEGNIPKELGNLTKLKNLTIDNNRLTGTVPTELGKLTQLVTLFLNNNQFDNGLPQELNNLVNLQELYLAENNFTLIPELNNLRALGTLDVRNNRLGFESLETLIRVASFSYNPQKPRDTTNLVLATGANMLLETKAGGRSNLYQWFAGFNRVANTVTYAKDNMRPQDTNIYACDVTNSTVPNLIIRYVFNVKVVPVAPQINRPLDYCIGDGQINLVALGDNRRDTKWTWFNGTTVVTETKEAFAITAKQDVDTVRVQTIVRNGINSQELVVTLFVRPIIREVNGKLVVLDNNNAQNKFQWLLYDRPVAGATTKEFTPTQAGDYRVTLITAEGCSATSQIYQFGRVTAIEDELLKQSLTVFPNPSAEDFQLKIENDYIGEIKLSVVDALGRTVVNTQQDKTSSLWTYQLAATQLPSGAYLLKVQTEKGFAYKRIVKQ